MASNDVKKDLICWEENGIVAWKNGSVCEAALDTRMDEADSPFV